MKLSLAGARYKWARYATGFAVGALYFWISGIGAVNGRFVWDSGLTAFYATVRGSAAVNGYYDLLGRAFAQGRLQLPVEPAPELRGLPDPWSDQVNRPYRLLDTVLYRGHYYLYHGATPALLLFTPWYLLTRHDLPENFVAFLLSLGGYLLLSALFTEVLSLFSIRLPIALYTLFLIALGVAQSVPFLLHRVKVYEVAIACGYFCLIAGFYCIFRQLTGSGKSSWWAVVSGMSFGLAIGCRPHLGVAALSVFALLLLLRVARKNVIAFAVPVLVCGAGIAAYNYLRFGNPLEFGTRYLLGGDTYRNFRLSGTNLASGLYYLLVSPWHLTPEFPFVRLSSPSVPPGYFLEPIAGVLSLCPLTLLAPVLLIWRKPWKGERIGRGFLAAMFVSTAAIILVLAAVPFSSQRYEVDFMPYLLLIACVVAGALLNTMRRTAIRGIAIAAITAITLYCITTNLALAIQGPYDQFVQASPRTYVNLARRFSPVQRFRPLLNPRLRVQAVFGFPAPCPARREPLLSAGEFGSRYLLSAECAGAGQIRLISETSVLDPDVRTVDLPFPGPGWYAVGLDFTPDTLVMSVSWNDRIVLQHPLRFLVTAPSQIHFGRDPALGNRMAFEGQIAARNEQIR